MIIAVLNQKGGVGKTTIAMHLAHGFSGRGRKTMLVDADPQGSAINWIERRGDRNNTYSCVAMPSPILHKELLKLAHSYDIIIVDCPPALADITKSALVSSTLALIPLQPSPVDIESAVKTLRLIDEVRTFNDKLQVRLLINRKIHNMAFSRGCRRALEHYNVPVFAAEISQRAALMKCALTGSTVFEYEPASQSVVEFNQLIDEILTGGVHEKESRRA